MELDKNIETKVSAAKLDSNLVRKSNNIENNNVLKVKLNKKNKFGIKSFRCYFSN